MPKTRDMQLSNSRVRLAAAWLLRKWMDGEHSVVIEELQTLQRAAPLIVAMMVGDMSEYERGLFCRIYDNLVPTHPNTVCSSIMQLSGYEVEAREAATHKAASASC